MNKKEYLIDLLTLCTEPQLNMYNRMYPDGPRNLDIAINQIKQTILNLNKKVDVLKDIEKEFNLFKERTKEIEKLADKEIDRLNIELKLLQNELEMIRNPINAENTEVQERLEKLYKLEAAGVDNWEWYDEAMSRND